MHSSVLTGTVSVPGQMSASGSRGIIHIQSGVVAVARPTGKISCFPPPLVCIKTVPLARISFIAEPSSALSTRSGRAGQAAAEMRFGNVFVAASAASGAALNRNSVPSCHIACIITASRRATATQALL
jgi:hypothetical protein